MLSQTIRSSCYSVVRLARQQASSSSSSSSARRAFGTTTLRQADLVQDMYLNQLKNYKVPSVKASDAEGQVHTFNAPKAPQAPEIANESELKDYEKQAVETEMVQASSGESTSAEHDWFEDEDFGEDEKDAHH